jgi:hypothetical protein
MRARALFLVVVLVLLGAPVARASDWGLIRPGASTTQTVRARYHAPTRIERPKVEGYDTESWIYEGEQAPSGIERLTVDFGIVQDGKYHADIVRSFRLEPHGSTFNRGIVSNGWGFPDRAGRQGDEEFFLYKDGLLVYFAPDGWSVRLMIFTPPQPRDPTEERR